MLVEFMLQLLLNKCDDLLTAPSGTHYLSGGVLHNESKSTILIAIRRSQDDTTQKVSGCFSVPFQMPGISVGGQETISLCGPGFPQNHPLILSTTSPPWDSNKVFVCAANRLQQCIFSRLITSI